MFKECIERGIFESTEQCLCDQARAVRKNGYQTLNWKQKRFK